MGAVRLAGEWEVGRRPLLLAPHFPPLAGPAPSSPPLAPPSPCSPSSSSSSLARGLPYGGRPADNFAGLLLSST